MINWRLLHPEEDAGGGEDVVAEVEAGLAEQAEEAEPAEPEGPLSLSDDLQLQWDGLEQPLTGRELRDGYLRQQDYTRKTQEIAEQRKEWEQKAQEAQQWQQYARQMEAALQRQNAKPKEDPLAEVWKQTEQQGGIPTDRELKALIQHVQDNTVGPLAQQNQQLAQTVQALWQEVQRRTDPINTLFEERKQSAQTRAVETALSRAKVSEAEQEAAKQWAELLYDRYEPDTSKGETWQSYNEEAFPKMFDEWWSRTRQTSRERDKQDLARAKQDALPGRGGGATPSKPMKARDDSPEEIVEQFFKD